jgi:hypothetical protein
MVMVSIHSNQRRNPGTTMCKGNPCYAGSVHFRAPAEAEQAVGGATSHVLYRERNGYVARFGEGLASGMEPPYHASSPHGVVRELKHTCMPAGSKAGDTPSRSRTSRSRTPVQRTLAMMPFDAADGALRPRRHRGSVVACALCV